MSSKVKKREREDQNEPQDYSEYRPKKLRMIVKERSALTILEDAAKVTNPAASLRFLREFQHDFLPNVKLSDCRSFVTALCALALHSPSDNVDCRLSSVQSVANIFTNESIQSGLSYFVNDVIDLLQKLIDRGQPNDCVCYSQLLYLIGPTLLSCNDNISIIDSVNKMCNEAISGQDWMIRVASMRWLVNNVRHKAAKIFWQSAFPKNDRSHSQDDEMKMSFSSPQSISNSQKYIEELLCSLMTDRDPRVRTAAVESLLRNTELLPEEGGSSLSWNNYESFASLLLDSEENVRTNALRIIKHIADHSPDKKVAGANKGVTLRLVDDSFSKMCNAVHDLSLRVRTEAALLLGEFQNVSTSFLEQTLDKKLMSRMKFLTSGRSSNVQEWATGRRFGEDAPVEKLEEETCSLIPSGACGAFVTGLEDEFMVVRQASVRSLSELATGRPSFAAKAVDFLADMFNDEIEEVRLDAVNYLRPLVQHTMLHDEQMQPILNMLDDAMADSRLALRELLTDCRLANTAAVRMTVDALLNNLRRYPADKESVWTCMRNLGRSHPAQISPFVVDMLGIHEYLHGPEPTLDNHSYMARLVLVLNAAYSCPTIQSLFPDFVWKQHRFLHESSPTLVPLLKPWKLLDNNNKLDEEGKEDNVWRETLRKLAMVQHMSPHLANDLLQLVMRDLSKLGELGGLCQVGALYLLACCKLRSSLGELVNSLRQTVDIGGLQRSYDHLSAQVKSQILSMELLYSCDDVTAILFLCQCRLRFVIARVVAEGVNPANVATLLSAFQQFKTLLGDKNDEDNLKNQSFCQALEGHIENIVNGDWSQLTVLVNIMNEHNLVLPTSIRYDMVKEKQCTITEPEPDCETVIRFVAGLVTALPLSASMRGFSDMDVNLIRVRVEYPDGRVQLQRPRPTDIRRLSPSLIRLSMQVLFKASLWSHKATVKITIGLLNESSNLQPDSQAVASFMALKGTSAESHTDTCSVNVSLFPKSKC